MPSRSRSDRIAARQPLQGIHFSLVLVIAGFLILIAVSSGTRLAQAVTSYRVAHYLLDIHERLDALTGIGGLVLRHRLVVNTAANASNPLFDPRIIRDDANALLQQVARDIPALLPEGETLSRQLDESRQAWIKAATEHSIALPASSQHLLQAVGAGLRALIREAVSREGKMSILGEFRIAFWQFRLLADEESSAIATALTGGTLHDPRMARAIAVAEGRALLAMERMGEITHILGDPELTALVKRLQTGYREHLHDLMEIGDPATPRISADDFMVRMLPLTQDYAQLGTATHQAGKRAIENIRQQRARELLVSAALVLLELGLGIGLVVFLMRRVQAPLTRLQMALSGADGYFVDWHVPSRVVDYSTGFDIMLGFEPGEIPRTVDGLRWLYHPEDAPRLEAAHRAAYRGDTDRVDADLRMRRKNGGWHWINIRVRVVDRDGDGRAVRLIGIVYDAQARHLAEDELRRLRHEEEAIFNSSPVAMMVVHDRIILRCNRATEQMFEREPGGLDGQPTRLLFDTEADYTTVGNQVYEALRKQLTYTYDAEYLRPRHGRFWARVQCSLLDPATPEMGYVFAFVDISATRQAQADLDTAIQRQRAMFTALPNGMLILRNRKVVDCNPRLAAMYGYTQTELIGQSTRIFHASDLDWETRGKTTYAAMAGGATYQGREKVRRRDGSFLDVLIQGCWIDPADPDKGAVFIHTPLNLMLDYPGGSDTP